MAASTSYSVHHKESEHRFTIDVFGDGKVIAFLGYSSPSHGIISLDTTQVPKEAAGKGIAVLLCDAAFAHATQKGLKVVPVCSYISGNYVPKHPEIQSIIASSL